MAPSRCRSARQDLHPAEDGRLEGRLLCISRRNELDHTPGPIQPSPPQPGPRRTHRHPHGSQVLLGIQHQVLSKQALRPIRVSVRNQYMQPPECLPVQVRSWLRLGDQSDERGAGPLSVSRLVIEIGRNSHPVEDLFIGARPTDQRFRTPRRTRQIARIPRSHHVVPQNAQGSCLRKVSHQSRHDLPRPGGLAEKKRQVHPPFLLEDRGFGRRELRPKRRQGFRTTGSGILDPPLYGFDPRVPPREHRAPFHRGLRVGTSIRLQRCQLLHKQTIRADGHPTRMESTYRLLAVARASPQRRQLQVCGRFRRLLLDPALRDAQGAVLQACSLKSADPHLPQGRKARVVGPCSRFRSGQRSTRVARSLGPLRQQYEGGYRPRLLLKQVLEGPHGLLVPAGLLQPCGVVEGPPLDDGGTWLLLGDSRSCAPRRQDKTCGRDPPRYPHGPSPDISPFRRSKYS